MLGYIVRRIIQSFWVLIGITIISFVVIHLAPGSPVGEALNPKFSPEMHERMIKAYELDKPLHVQYYLWWKKLLTGKLTSFKDGRSVMLKIAERLPATMLLQAVSFVIVFAIAIPLGIFSATHRYSLADNITTFLAFVGLSIPGFWLAYLLILLMVRGFEIPVLGVETFGLVPLPTLGEAMDRLWHLFLPSLVLSIGGIASISRYMRASFLEVMRQDYIRTARAKGLSEDRVLYKHGLRNALMPIITIFGYILPGLIGGSVIMESIFAWPGIGRLDYQAILQRDYPVIMTINTIAAALVLLGNLLADILYAVVDPRVRYR